MMQRLLIITFTGFILLLSNCSNSPTKPTSIIDKTILQSLTTLQMVDYDQIQLSATFSSTVDDSTLRYIYLGQRQQNGFIVWDSSKIAYRVDQNNQIHPLFQLNHLLDAQWSPNAEITVRYQFRDDVSTDIDRRIAIYKYPFESEEIYYTYQDLFRKSTDNWSNARVQDFALAGNTMYVHPFGPLGIAEIDLTSDNVMN